ncbi:hypothetical protein J7T55_011959 [Diaporthe amygdali]|uniref:uncharacterized protein n=1 Tax=Phomopsis amygdali TaxID=1214568 RepID=UPI0022FF16C9|nr:uncharacterized protein J7T55_011959 [Diaporthe amygdali]KAJ0123494.1 hypothetical protein J7T55_011959 [Diaporthe amygdali]
MKEVRPDEALADQEFGSGLRTGPLLGGMAVGIVLSFEGSPKAGQPRSDKFLAHLTEGHMKETFESLQEQVEEARRRHHVRSIEVWLCYRNPASLWDDDDMIWNSQMLYGECELIEGIIEKTKALSTFVQLHSYHVLQKTDMCVTEEGKIRIRRL